MVSGAGRTLTRRSVRAVRPRADVTLPGRRRRRSLRASAAAWRGAHPASPAAICASTGAAPVGVEVAGLGHHQAGDVEADPPVRSRAAVAGRSVCRARAMPSRREPSVGETRQARASWSAIPRPTARGSRSTCCCWVATWERPNRHRSAPPGSPRRRPGCVPAARSRRSGRRRPRGRPRWCRRWRGRSAPRAGPASRPARRGGRRGGPEGAAAAAVSMTETLSAATDKPAPRTATAKPFALRPRSSSDRGAGADRFDESC